jgi:hypothetical protein
VNLSAFQARFGVDVWMQHRQDLEPFVEDGILIYDAPILRLPRAGMLLAHEIMAVFISATVR